MTDETRFHALKFALQNFSGTPEEVVAAATLYYRFLTGAPDQAPEVAEQPDIGRPTQKWAPPTALDTMVTESLAAAETAVSTFPGVSDFVDGQPVLASAEEDEGNAYAAWQETSPAHITNEEAEAQGLPTNTDQLGDWLAKQPDWPAPTFEQVAAAVQEIASPPPPADSDPSDEPELTTEQCERYEDTLRAADRVAVAPKEPEPEVKPAKAAWVDYVS